MKKILIAVIGPTGTGKTDYSISLAKHFGCEIISADSRQFFKGLTIGAAPPSPSQLNEVPHHFVGFLPLEEYYSASLFERDVLSLLKKLFDKNNIVILTGGSTLYVDAIFNGMDDIPDIDPKIREKYIAKYKNEGIEGLRIALKILDPVHYEKVDLKNHKRIIRALEICDATGKPYSSFLTGEKKQREFNILKVGIRRPRKELYDRIDNRVDKMIADGLEQEVINLLPFRGKNSLDTVGYKEFFGFFDGQYDISKTIELIKRNSRRYAKRQMTWWGRDSEINWFDTDGGSDIISFTENLLENEL
jgi:tRNA dimethylallyltransferase